MKEARDAVWLKLVGLLAQIEARVEELYRLYAQRFPAYHAFWDRLAHDEQEHAAIMRAFHELGEADWELLPLQGIEPKGLEFHLRQITLMIEQAQAGQVTLARAATNTLGIETTIVEGRIYQSVRSDATSETIDRIREQTAGHRQMAEELWARVTAGAAPK